MLNEMFLDNCEDVEQCLVGEDEVYDQSKSLSSYLETHLCNILTNLSRYKIAAIHKDSSLSYQTLNDKANIMSRNIRKLLNPEQCQTSTEICIGLLIFEGFDRLISILSCLKLGLTAVPLSSDKTSNILQKIIKETNIHLIIYDRNNAKNVDNIKCEVRFISVENMLSEIDNVEYENLLPAEVIIRYKPENSAIVLNTSGSSGITKMIKLTHGQIFNRLFWQWKKLPYKDGERVCHRTGFMFVDNIVECLSCLLSGITMVIVSPVEACDFVRLATIIHQHEISWILCIPTLLQKWLNEIQVKRHIGSLLGTLSTVVSSGEMLLPTLALKFMESFPWNQCILVNLYGSTEMTGDVTCHVFYNKKDIQKYTKNGFLAVGFPISNNKVFLIDENKEIVVTGANVSPSCGSIFRTGDVGFIHDKVLYLSGRIDDMVKVNGKKVFTKKIDDVIMLNEEIDQCCTVHVSMSGKNFFVSFFTLNISKVNITKVKSDLSKNVKKHITDFGIHRFEYILTLPTLSNSLKPDKMKLKSIAKDLLQKEKIMDFRDNELEQLEICEKDDNSDKDQFWQVHSILAKHLAISPKELLGSMDFYEVGGDSLVAVACIADLNSKGFVCYNSVFLKDYEVNVDTKIESIVDKIVNCTFCLNQEKVMQMMSKEIIIEQFRCEHQSEIVEFFVDHFFPKDELGMYFNYTLDMFKTMFNGLLDEVIQENLSFLVRDAHTGKLLGLQLLETSAKNTTYTSPSNLPITVENVLLHFLEYGKTDIPEKKSPSLYTVVFALDSRLPKSKIIQLCYFIEFHCLHIARSNGYKMIETLNTSKVTYEICKEIGYEVIKTSSAREFVKEIFPTFQSTSNIQDVYGYYMIKEID